MQPDNDIIFIILNNIKNGILLFDIADDSQKYLRLFIINCGIILIDIILMIITLAKIKVKEIKSLIFIINTLNIIIFHYLLGPSLVICLMMLSCNDEQENYLKIICFTNQKILFNILSIIMFLL